MTVPDRVPRRHRQHHAKKDRVQRRRTEIGDVERMLGTDCHPVLVKRFGRHEITFSRHALQAWLKRVDYHPSTEWHGVNELDKMLARHQPECTPNAPNEVLPLSLYAHARNHSYLCVADGCFTVQRNPGGKLVATTYLSYRNGE